MACKYHHLNSWGQTEGKKKQAAGVTGGWVRYVSRYLDGDVPRIFQSSFINFGPRSSPVTELLSPGRRSLSQIQFGLSHPLPNWTIKSKWGRNLKLGTTSISLVKQQDMLVTGCGSWQCLCKNNHFILCTHVPQLLCMPDRWPESVRTQSS